MAKKLTITIKKLLQKLIIRIEKCFSNANVNANKNLI